MLQDPLEPEIFEEEEAAEPETAEAPAAKSPTNATAPSSGEQPKEKLNTA
jgi:hypothetical protein